MRCITRFFFATILLLGMTYAFAVEPDISSVDKQQEMQKFVAGLHFQSGTVAVPKAGATLKLTPEFRYLDDKDAQRVLEDLWGNPPDSDILGMLVPTSAPLSDLDTSWAIVLTYSEDGHISDADAAKINYDEMLKQMQQSTHEASAERVKQGYRAIELVGWAQPPHYDAVSNKLYWAKELKFDGASKHTLNYDIRALGRSGYLSMNAVAGMDQLPTVQRDMQKVLAMTEFDNGKRYTDFNASTDKVAAYGLGALVAGAIAAKAGLFAKLFVALLAAKKIIFAGVLAFGAAISRFFRGKPKP